MPLETPPPPVPRHETPWTLLLPPLAPRTIPPANGLRLQDIFWILPCLVQCCSAKKKKRIRKKKVQCACRKRTKQKPSRLLPLGAVSRTPPRRRADGIFLCLFYFHLIPPSLKKIGSAKLAIKEPSFVRRSALDVRSGLYSCFGVPAVGMRSSGCFFCPSLVWRHCTA